MGLYIGLAWLSAIQWIGVGLSAIFVAIRTFVQYRNSKKLFINDYWIFFAMVCHLATAIVYQLAIPPMYEMMEVSYQMEAPTEGFMAHASLFLRLQYALDFLLWTTLWSVKFSLLFFFWRLFDSVQTPMRIFWWTMCGITAATWVTCVVLQNFACAPIKNFFTPGLCASEHDIYYSNLVFKFSAGTDIAGDIFIMMIPFPLIRKLQVNTHKRWVLVTLFSLPLIPIIFAIVRFVINNPDKGNVDPVKFALFSMVENTVAIVSSCLPSLRLFVVNARTPTHTRSGDSRHQYYGQGTGDYFRSKVYGTGTGTGMGTGTDTRDDEFRLDPMQRGRGADEDSVTGMSSNESERGIVGGNKMGMGMGMGMGMKGRVLVTHEFEVR